MSIVKNTMTTTAVLRLCTALRGCTSRVMINGTALLVEPRLQRGSRGVAALYRERYRSSNS